MGASEGYIPQQLPDPMIRPRNPKLTRHLSDEDSPYDTQVWGKGVTWARPPGAPGRQEASLGGCVEGLVYCLPGGCGGGQFLPLEGWWKPRAPSWLV